MASPLSKDLLAGAIGESGSLLGTLRVVPLAKGEQTGIEFAKGVGANSLAELRAMPADSILQAAAKFDPLRFSMTIDGYFFPKNPIEIFQAGEQAHVPLLVGWNSKEKNYKALLGNDKTTKENFIKAVKKLYGERSDEALEVYDVTSDSEVEQVATDMAGDKSIGYGTWKWAELQAKTGGKNVYRYYYTRPRPAMSAKRSPKMPADKRAVHSAEIEYAMGNLSSNKTFEWTRDDYKVSKIMQEYFANFIKKGDPNGSGLPEWPAIDSDTDQQYLQIDVKPAVHSDKNRQRYLFMEKVILKKS